MEEECLRTPHQEVRVPREQWNEVGGEARMREAEQQGHDGVRERTEEGGCLGNPRLKE